MKECVLITGAAKNTGRVTAQLFAEKGLNVILTARNGENVQLAAKEIAMKTNATVIGIEFNQGETDTIVPLFEKIEEMGFVVSQLIMNAAAQGMDCDAFNVSEEEWSAVIHTNVVGGFLCARESARRMIKHNVKGSILFVGSNTAYHAIRNRSSYIASKGALASLVKALTLDFGGYGIRVNCLMPGPIHTDRWDALTEEQIAFRRNRAPLKKEAQTIDIANAIYYLSSELSANTTGAELIIDGGMHVQLHPSM